MVKAHMTMALDGKGIGPKRHTTTSGRVGDQWYVWESGPNYSNAFQVDEYDERGLAWLEAHEERAKGAADG